MDLDRVEQLVRLFGGSRAQELVVEADGWHVSLRRGSGPVTVIPSGSSPEVWAVGPAEAVPPPLTVSITAPLVGIFRQGEVPLAPGDRVRAGAPVGAIESMKILNPVVAEVGGELVEALVEDGHPVEYGEPLFVLLPLPGREEEE